jgi:hypothetical protein
MHAYCDTIVMPYSHCRRLALFFIRRHLKQLLDVKNIDGIPGLLHGA